MEWKQVVLERALAEKFKEIFLSYTILSPINNSIGGWPDKLIQLPNSRVVAAELKIGTVNKHEYFTLTNFRADQAAWLAKWQRSGGLAILFVGVVKENKHIGYFIVSFDVWNKWLDVNKQRYYLEDVFIYTDIEAIKVWFKQYAQV